MGSPACMSKLAKDRNTEMTNETEDIQAVEKLGEARDGVVKELRKVIVGM